MGTSLGDKITIVIALLLLAVKVCSRHRLNFEIRDCLADKLACYDVHNSMSTMSAFGQKQTFCDAQTMSAYHQKRTSTFNGVMSA